MNSRQDGILLLSSINLPGGVQRRRTEADVLLMRSYFAENDLISVSLSYCSSPCSLHVQVDCELTATSQLLLYAPGRGAAVLL
jgi:exosome complex component RRP4